MISGLDPPSSSLSGTEHEVSECNDADKTHASSAFQRAEQSMGDKVRYLKSVALEEDQGMWDRLGLSEKPKDWDRSRQRVAFIMVNKLTEVAIGLVLVCNVVFVVAETDYMSVEGEAPGWLRSVLQVFMFLFCMEISARIYVLRSRYFETTTNIVDLLIVGVDLACEVLTSFLGQIPSISILRVFRIMRLMRLIRVIKAMRELALMVHGLVGALRAIIWAAVLLFVMLTVWSVIAVELIHPLNLIVAAEGAYVDCPRCERSFRTVMSANLTFATQILAGDSWGQVTVPLIERFPWTAPFFLAVLLSVNLGVMNLILSVIVDRAIEARHSDMESAIKEKQNAFKTAREALTQLFVNMDKDDDGYISAQELEIAFMTNRHFAKIVGVMDANYEDLSTIFAVLDSDNSGLVAQEEFVEQLYKMKTQDSHTLLVFIKHYLVQVREAIRKEYQLISGDILRNQEVHKQKLDSVKEAFGIQSAGTGPNAPACNKNSEDVHTSLAPSAPGAKITATETDLLRDCCRLAAGAPVIVGGDLSALRAQLERTQRLVDEALLGADAPVPLAEVELNQACDGPSPWPSPTAYATLTGGPSPGPAEPGGLLSPVIAAQGCSDGEKMNPSPGCLGIGLGPARCSRAVSDNPGLAGHPELPRAIAPAVSRV